MEFNWSCWKFLANGTAAETFSHEYLATSVVLQEVGITIMYISYDSKVY